MISGQCSVGRDISVSQLSLTPDSDSGTSSAAVSSQQHNMVEVSDDSMTTGPADLYEFVKLV